jgi:hypothetical protein
VVVVLDDLMNMVTWYDAAVVLEVEHFVEVTDGEVCRGGCEGGEAVAEVGGGAMECGTGQVRNGVDCGQKSTANGAVEGMEL